MKNSLSLVVPDFPEEIVATFKSLTSHLQMEAKPVTVPHPLQQRYTNGEMWYKLSHAHTTAVGRR